MYHEHPLRILRYSAKNIWLLVFPLIRGLRAFTPDFSRFYSWLKGAWFDILILGIILLFGFIRWYFSRITITDAALIHNEGVFIRLKKYIPYKNMSTVTCERSFYLRPFGAMRLYCDTGGGAAGKSDMTLMVSERISGKILGNASVTKLSGRKFRKRNTAMTSVLLFSVFFSSSLSGAIYVAALFFKGGDIVKDMLNVQLSRITEETARLTDRLVVRLPAAAVGIGVFLLAMWIVSFFLNFVRYSGFSLETSDHTVRISCGVFTRREFRINTRHINYTDLRQNLIMKLFRAVAVNISCAGYGSLRKNFPLLLPMNREENFVVISSENEFKPPPSSFWQYIWQPTVAAVLVPPASYILERFVPEYSEFSFFTVIMLEIPALWMIAVKVTALITSGVSLCGDKIAVRYSKGIGFHTIIAERSRLVKISVTQTPFQRLRRRCTIGFFFSGESQHGHSVKAIKHDEARKIKELLNFS